MQYYGLKSIIASQKKPIPITKPSESFFGVTKRVTPYIPPSLTKEEFPSEKPTILLVSAVGASGKTTTAHALAHDTGIPVLDLAKHKPVADNTLTGLLTSAYDVQDIGSVLSGLSTGSHGVIIDGIDEGRSKTNEKAFEAFLDDLIVRCQSATTTAIVIFGRGQALLSTWVYLADKGVDVGLVSIDPFSVEQAKTYIDAYAEPKADGNRAQYEQARDRILKTLGAAFSSSDTSDQSFLTFIGYPPVLDAIATLLREEQNYHRLSEAVAESESGETEVQLLIRIGTLLLRREREEKALPNFISSLATKASEKLGAGFRQSLYNEEEQCARILTRAMGGEFSYQVIEDPALRDEYEKSLDTWCPEHPFLGSKGVRNPVFAALAVARCALSNVSQYRQIAIDYVRAIAPTYHLLYIMGALAERKSIDVAMFNSLIQACSDFVSKDRKVQIDLSGLSWEESDIPEESVAELEITVSVEHSKSERSFQFTGSVHRDQAVPFGPFLNNATITLPCAAVIRGAPALDCTGCCTVSSKQVVFETDVVVRGVARGDEREQGLFVEAKTVEGHASSANVKGGKIEISCVDHKLAFPLAQYVKRIDLPILDPQSQEKFRRLRRILSEFASHSKGGLAKYRPKIEHERVLRGKLGENLLAQLLKEGVLTSDPKFYYVDAVKIASILGLTWQQLRQHQVSAATEAFLRRVPNAD